MVNPEHLRTQIQSLILEPTMNAPDEEIMARLLHTDDVDTRRLLMAELWVRGLTKEEYKQWAASRSSPSG